VRASVASRYGKDPFGLQASPRSDTKKPSRSAVRSLWLKPDCNP
jgi:hypothetical protein